MKRTTNQAMLKRLRAERAVGAVSQAIYGDRSTLTRALTADPDAKMTEGRVAQIMDALERVQTGAPTA